MFTKQTRKIFFVNWINNVDYSLSSWWCRSCGCRVCVYSAYIVTRKDFWTFCSHALVQLIHCDTVQCRSYCIHDINLLNETDEDNRQVCFFSLNPPVLLRSHVSNARLDWIPGLMWPTVQGIHLKIKALKCSCFFLNFNTKWVLFIDYVQWLTDIVL